MEVKYTGVVGAKFHEDGAFRYYPGNTVVCKLNDQKELVKILEWVQSKFKELPFSYKFAFLPPHSFHMTAIELVCEQPMNKNDSWPKLVSEKNLEAVDQFFYQVISRVEHPNVNMRYNGVSCKRIKLVPATGEDEQKIKTYRKEVAKVTGLNNYDDRYEFHISLSYIVITLTEEEKKQVEELEKELDQILKTKLNIIHVGKPLYTIFNDMSDFVPYENGRENLGWYKK